MTNKQVPPDKGVGENGMYLLGALFFFGMCWYMYFVAFVR